MCSSLVAYDTNDTIDERVDRSCGQLIPRHENGSIPAGHPWLSRGPALAERMGSGGLAVERHPDLWASFTLR